MSKPRAAALGNGVVSTTGALTGRHILEEPFSATRAEASALRMCAGQNGLHNTKPRDLRESAAKLLI